MVLTCTRFTAYGLGMKVLNLHSLNNAKVNMENLAQIFPLFLRKRYSPQTEAPNHPTLSSKTRCRLAHYTLSLQHMCSSLGLQYEN